MTKQTQILDGIGQGLTTSKVVSAARTEKNFQIKLDSMQLAVARGEVTLSKEAESAKKELDRIKKVEADLKERGLAPISEYSMLQALYKGRISQIQKKDLDAIAVDKALKFMNRSFDPSKVTDKQKEVISAYFAIQAKKEWAIIDRVKSVLAWRYGQEKKKTAQENPVAVEEGVVVEQ